MASLNVDGDTFHIYNLADVINGDITFKSIGAVYLFTKENLDSTHKILYVGRTEDLADRGIRTHHKLPCVYLNGGTSFCAHTENDEASRKLKENSIKSRYNPPCNDTPVARNKSRFTG